jgi:hypothetical protein
MEAATTVTLDVTSCILEDSRALPQHIKLWQDSILLFCSLAILESKPSIVVNNTSLSPCHSDIQSSKLPQHLWTGGAEYEINSLNNLFNSINRPTDPFVLRELTFARVDFSLLRAHELWRILLPLVQKLSLHQCEITAELLQILKGPNGRTILTSLEYVSWSKNSCSGPAFGTLIMANPNLEELRLEAYDDAWTKLSWTNILKTLPQIRLLDSASEAKTLRPSPEMQSL